MSLVSGIEIKVNGSDVTQSAHVSEIRIEDNLMAPDTCTLRMPGRLGEATGDEVTFLPCKLGDKIEVKLAAPDETASLKPLFVGEITSLEPEFTARRGIVFTVRAYDKSHRLNRDRKSRDFQDVTYGDVAQKVAGEAGLQADIEGDTGSSHKIVQQTAETDWALLWRLASRIGYEVYVQADTLHFRPLGGTQEPTQLKLGEKLQSFRSRVTGVQQVEAVTVRGWDPTRKEEIEAKANGKPPASTIGIAFDTVKSAFSTGPGVLIGNAPVTTQAEAQKVADSVMAKLRDSYLEAEGEAHGDPALRAGSKVKIEGLGKDYSGEYVLSSTTHIYAAERGYNVRFRINGRTQRTLLDLMTPGKQAPWANGLVIGVVTNNKDPDALGRVRVKFPTLGSSGEGWWARVGAINAGDQRGSLMLPQVGDEVIVGFEHGDATRPFVLGSLWNGKTKPGDLAAPEGNFELWADEKVHIKAKKDIVIETDAAVTVKAKGDATVEAQGNVSVKASGSGSVEATGQLTLKGMGVTIDGGGGMVKVSGSQIMLG